MRRVRRSFRWPSRPPCARQAPPQTYCLQPGCTERSTHSSAFTLMWQPCAVTGCGLERIIQLAPATVVLHRCTPSGIAQMHTLWHFKGRTHGDRIAERIILTLQNYWIPDGIPKQAKSKAAGDAKEAAEEGQSMEGSGVDVDVGEEGTAEPEQATAAAPAASKTGGTSGLMSTTSLHQLAGTRTALWCELQGFARDTANLLL